MKKLILFLLLVMIAIAVNAQIKSSLIFSTAQVKYQGMERIGTLITAVGGVTVVTGNILFWKVYNNPNQENPGAKASKYRDLIFGGIGLLAVGIPLLTIGKTNLRHIEIQARAVRFNGLASANGIGINIRF